MRKAPLGVPASLLAALLVLPAAPAQAAQASVGVRLEPQLDLRHNAPARRHATFIKGFDATPEPVRRGRKITLRGWLAYQKPGDPLLSPVAKRTVKIYFRAAKTGKWTYAGSDVTDKKGFFSLKATAKRDGYWRASFAGDRRFLRSFGRDDHVDVR
ncbi:hypothetical protein [Actinomadura rudentiformis]|uniref:DUF2911 domain-containing protein n=1 Tax=Actinomadura rudentiformis TaxID=359158 RepID=A0A6H9YNG8_9ACTN|nr:hypothetical protein [Actinomadura rudentiformis]KAB2348524.1 hypothetical protein F8566_17240 [Actinomadura rudentiformis]